MAAMNGGDGWNPLRLVQDGISQSINPFPNIYYRDFEIVKVSAVNEGIPPNRILRQLPAGPMLILPVGPLLQYPAAAPEGEEQHQNIDLIQWLAEKEEHSAFFASFGSEYFLTKEEIIEIAFGLELSDNVNFIWALRLPKGEENRVQLEQILPEGFLERVRDRRRAVQGGAPQALISGHSSIGGFISHCGWGSVLEAIEFGVPILAMPMNYEQPLNARLMVENGLAVEIMRDEKGDL
ncbi:beta-D-glucosyl crocetin beta-1,6-glucosyltransferase-like [Coffea eugenioides]|uniref:beta-D-glucosyl crocetin beta-1,6-glucosyltransferase-like n=1 Tax=Coffea eugenioides TaxID=49369 RepID=UPI000F607A06|nr:beta-D-glucosyl crocetin beta-1,6-glucosyltransferase-like [Coffea eugenioides]